MKPPAGFSEKVRARITEITGTDPGPFKVGSYTPGTNPNTTEAQLVEAMAQSMARMKPEDVVEDGCGCIWCDVGLEPERPFTDALVHKTARGTFRCTNPNRK